MRSQCRRMRFYTGIYCSKSLLQGYVVQASLCSPAPQTAAARKFLEKLRGALEERLCDEALSPEKLAKAFRTETPFLHARIKGLLGIGTEEAIESYKLDRAA